MLILSLLSTPWTKPGREIGGGESRGRRADKVEQPQRILRVVGAGCSRIEVVEAIADERLDVLGFTEEGEALEGADADVAVAEADQHRRAGG